MNDYPLMRGTILNRMNSGGQTGNINIQPMAPDAAYDIGERVNNATQELKGDAMHPLAGKYIALMT